MKKKKLCNANSFVQFQIFSKVLFAGVVRLIPCGCPVSCDGSTPSAKIEKISFL